MNESSNVDSLRRKLRDLGYLDAGVDRFVLAPARAGLGSWGLVWRASLRMGLLAALLVGVPATVAVAARLPTLVTGVADAALLVVYIGGVAGAMTAAVALAVLMAAARVGHLAAGRPDAAGRARRVARIAGVLVAVAALGYLTLWWRTVAATATAAAFPATALALGLATAVALLLGHTTTVVALAVLAGSSGHGDGPRMERSRTSRLVLALVTIMASATLFALAPRGDADHPSDAPPVVVVPSGLRLLVIGIDGFDPVFARDIARREHLPALGDALADTRLTLPREPAWDPVAVWMSIATAQPPERHGALGVEARRLAGLAGRMPGEAQGLGALLAASTDLLRLTQPIVSSASERRERTFWELGAAAGLRTIAINWWTTWPAAPADGVVLTERAALRLDKGGPLQGEMAPPGLYDTLRPGWPAVQTAVAQTVTSLTGDLAAPEAEIVARALGVDATQLALAGLLDLEQADLATVYLPGADIAQAGLFTAVSAGSASSMARRVAALDRVYRHLDAALARLRTAAPDHALVLVTHPGRVREGLPALMMTSGLPPASGVAIARSPARLEDVGATILHLLGLPLSRQLTGQVRTEVLPAAFMTQHPRRYVERYARRTGPAIAAGAEPGALDAEARERLRSLGYVR